MFSIFADRANCMDISIPWSSSQRNFFRMSYHENAIKKTWVLSAIRSHVQTTKLFTRCLQKN